MYIVNGIACAGEPEKPLTAVGVRPMDGFRLWIRFSDGTAKVFDFKRLLSSSAFSPLKDQAVFNSVYIDYGVPVWNDGEIDISPDYLYRHGEPAGGAGDA